MVALTNVGTYHISRLWGLLRRDSSSFIRSSRALFELWSSLWIPRLPKARHSRLPSLLRILYWNKLRHRPLPPSYTILCLLKGCSYLIGFPRQMICLKQSFVIKYHWLPFSLKMAAYPAWTSQLTGAQTSLCPSSDTEYPHFKGQIIV